MFLCVACNGLIIEQSPIKCDWIGLPKSVMVGSKIIDSMTLYPWVNPMSQYSETGQGYPFTYISWNKSHLLLKRRKFCCASKRKHKRKLKQEQNNNQHMACSVWPFPKGFTSFSPLVSAEYNWHNYFVGIPIRKPRISQQIEIPLKNPWMLLFIMSKEIERALQILIFGRRIHRQNNVLYTIINLLKF